MIMLKEDSANCKLEGFCLEGQKAEAVDQGQYGIAVQGTHHRLTNMTVHDINYFPNDWIGSDIGYGSVNAPAYGVAIYNASDIHVNGGVFYNCAYECFGVENSSDVTISGAYFGTALRVPLQIHRNTDSIQVMNCQIDNRSCPISSTTGGITMHGVKGETVSNVFIYGCTVKGGHVRGVQGGEYYITLENCVIEKSVYTTEAYNSDHDWVLINCEVGGSVKLYGTNMIRDSVDISL